MTCIINVYGLDVDVENLYFERGFTTLPPQLTISGNDLRRHGEVPGNYSIKKDGVDSPIAWNEAVPVKHGDPTKERP